MAKEHISADELNRALREHGSNSVRDAALVVLEVDGAFRVLKYGDVQGTCETAAAIAVPSSPWNQDVGVQ